MSNFTLDLFVVYEIFRSSFLPQVLGYADSEFVVENITVSLPPSPPS